MAIDWAAFGVDLHLELDSTAGRRAAPERAPREAIRAGRLAPGARLPATRTLLSTEDDVLRRALAYGLARVLSHPGQW